MRGRSWLLVGLLLLLPVANASAVTIDLRPDGPTTIGIGETVNVDVFLALDASDQAVGIGAATLHLELGSPFVSVVASGAGSAFPSVAVNVVDTRGFTAFAEFGATVTSPEAMLGTLAITGVNPGSYNLQARRFSNFPLFTAPGSQVNRYDFTSDETLLITVTCGSDVCVAPSPGPVDPLPPEPPPATTIPEVDVGEVASTEVRIPGQMILHTTIATHSGGVNYNLAGGQMELTAFAPAGSHSAAIPEPSALFLIGLSIAGLAILRPWRANT